MRLKRIAQCHYTRDISAAVTVVGRAPYGNYCAVFKVPFEALIDKLVGPRNELDVVDVVELACHFITK